MKTRTIITGRAFRFSVLAASIVVFAGFCLITNSAGVRRTYFNSAIPFSYQLHTSIPSNYIPGIEASHLSWNIIPASFWEFTRGANTTVTSVASDGVNLVFFDLAGVNFPPPSSVIAFSSTFTSSSGGYHAVESDLIWNARDFPPSPTGAPGQQDLQSVMTHEFGHHLGLDHTGLPGGASSGCGPLVQPATMWFSSSSGDTTKRSLHPEDVMGVSVLYPTWRLQGNVMNGAVPVVDAPLFFSGTYASIVGPVENPIGTRYNRSGYLLDTIGTDNGGLYSTIVINQSFDVIYDDFGYERDSAHIQFAPPGGIGQTETIIRNFVQQATPMANLNGTIRDASSLAPISTRIEFYGFGDPNGLTTTVTSAVNGTFSVPLPSKEYYRIRVVPPSPYVDEVEITSMYLSPAGENTTIDIPRAQVLIVDDDAGRSFQTTYQNSIDRTNRPRRTFSVADSGMTPATVLGAFTQKPVVLWFTGSDSTNALTTAERQVIMNHLSGGGRAIITGQNIAQFSAVSDSLLEGYLGIRFDGTPAGIFVRGYIGDIIGNGVNYIALGGVNAQTSMDILQLVGGSIGTVVPSLYYPAGSDTTDVAAVRVQGPGGWGATYFGFGLEGMTPARQDSLIVRSFRFFDQIVTGVENPSADALPMAFALDQNYPNPFNPATQIRYGLPQQSRVQLRVYDVLGREVARLFEGDQPAGYHSMTWKGDISSGSNASSGIYFYRIEATSADGHRFTDMKKMVLLK